MKMAGLTMRFRLLPFQVLMALAAFMVVLSDVAPAEAQSDDTLIVGNLEESSINTVNVLEGQQYAQSFCAGSAGTLSKVRMYSRSRHSDPAAAVTIRADSSGSPGTTLHTLTNPSMDNDVTTAEDFTSSGYALAAGATYWVVVHRPASAERFGFGVTELHDEYPAEPGWSIGDGLLFTSSGAEWERAFVDSSRPGGYTMRIAVYTSGGTTAPLPPVFPKSSCGGAAEPFNFSVNENAAEGTVVGTAAAEDPNDDSLAYSVSGTDAASFNQVFAIGAGTGEISVKTGASPDFETKYSYTITVNVTDSKDDSGATEDPAVTDDSVSVKINVNNLDEPGSVTISPSTARVGVELQASLSDPDSIFSGPTWQWFRSNSASGPFTSIGGATSATYTPGVRDEGKYLKAAASYIDRHQPGKSAEATTGSAVAPAGGL